MKSSQHRGEGKQGQTLGAYLPAADAAEIRLRAQVAQITVAEELRRAVRFWLSGDRTEEALQGAGEPEGRR